MIKLMQCSIFNVQFSDSLYHFCLKIDCTLKNENWKFTEGYVS